MSLLKINKLVRNYPGFSLGPLDLEINAGESVALVGANGAGKSSLFRSIMGLLRKQQGQVWIAGQPAHTDSGLWRQQLGYIGDHIPLFEAWTGARNLAVMSRFYPDWSQQRVDELVSRLELDLTMKVSTYSTGQRAKLGIVLALAHQPKLLLLDEPANGLDPVGRENFTDLLFEYLADGERALLYATHHVAEIEALVDRLVFLKQGQIVGDAIKEDLTERWRKLSFRSESDLTDIPGSVQQRQELPWRELICDDAPTTLAWLQDRGIEEIQSSRLPLEKITVQILRQQGGLQSPLATDSNGGNHV
ncbi:MAG: ABC transporter ATP-binding protein [Pseudomonadales bacterium]|nr:ABC transporter ATP-binding protein [Pseudomonadales bacterium]